MRTDVKVGLICVFGIILAVVIYYVALGNGRPQKAMGSDTSAVVTPAPAETPGGLQVAPAPSSDTHLSIASDTPPRQLAQIPSGGPGNGIGGPMITPPSPSSAITPGGGSAAGTQPGATPASGSGANSLIPQPPGTMPAGSSGGPSIGGGTLSGGTPIPPHATIEVPTPGTGGPHGSTSGMGGSTDFGGSTGMGGSSGGGGFSGLSGGTYTGSSSASTYTIAKGDMLGSIAKTKGVTLKALQAANPGVDSSKLKIGQVIKIPAVDTTPKTSTTTTPPSTRPSRATAHSGSASTTRPASGSAKPGGTYTVKKGDTLGKIAEAVYGDKSAWQKIFRANRSEVPDADVVAVGTVLKLPS